MSGYPGGRLSGLLTDLYELTMAAGYVQKHFEARATFELFVRHLPPHRNYLVAAGLEQALDFLGNVHFSSEDISYLRSLPLFGHVDGGFFEFLARFRFTGDVWALPEGTIFFPGEPLLRVTAPIAEAQLVETSLLSIVHLQTLIASKAARVTGTQAHSWIMAHEDESEAFSSFLDVFPEQSTLLVDTYDVRAAVEKIIGLGRKPRAIRLDSGDVLADSRWARERLDASGWNDVKIFVSGDLDECRIEALLRDGACVDSFGVGTALSTSPDAPSVGVIYKLVEVETDGQVRSAAKFSEEKKTYPGRKQVFRFTGKDGTFSSDVIGLDEESMAEAEALLVPVMRQGRRLEASHQDSTSAVKSARARFLTSRLRLPSHLLALRETTQPFPVHYSARLEELCDQMRQTFVRPASVGASHRQTISPATVEKIGEI